MQWREDPADDPAFSVDWLYADHVRVAKISKHPGDGWVGSINHHEGYQAVETRTFVQRDAARTWIEDWAREAAPAR